MVQDLPLDPSIPAGITKYERLRDDLLKVERYKNKTMKSGAQYDFSKKQNVIEYIKMVKSREMSARMRQGENQCDDEENALIA